MNVLENIWSTPPLTTNELGIKFWLDRSTTSYAKNKGLVDVVVFFTENVEGYRNRIITENQEVVWESRELEAIAAHIDIMALDRHWRNHEDQPQSNRSRGS